MSRTTPREDIRFDGDIALHKGIRDEKMVHPRNNMGGAHYFFIPSVFEARGIRVK